MFQCSHDTSTYHVLYQRNSLEGLCWYVAFLAYASPQALNGLVFVHDAQKNNTE
jgi:hypothetical protein